MSQPATIELLCELLQIARAGGAQTDLEVAVYRAEVDSLREELRRARGTIAAQAALINAQCEHIDRLEDSVKGGGDIAHRYITRQTKPPTQRRLLKVPPMRYHGGVNN